MWKRSHLLKLNKKVKSMRKVFIMYDFCTTSATKSKNKNFTKNWNMQRSLQRSFFKKSYILLLFVKWRATERPINSIFLYSSTKSFKKVTRSFTRSLHEVCLLKSGQMMSVYSFVIFCTNSLLSKRYYIKPNLNVWS